MQHPIINYTAAPGEMTLEPPERPILVLDLDDTVIFASTDEDGQINGFQEREFAIFDGAYTVHVRPHFSEFIQHALDIVGSIHVFSAGTEEYVDAIVKGLFCASRLANVDARSRCVFTAESVIKCLDKYDRLNTFMIDDRDDVYAQNKWVKPANNNTFLIERYSDNLRAGHDDTCLLEAIAKMRAWRDSLLLLKSPEQK